MNIKITPELRDLFPPLSDEEMDNLRESIKEHGIMSPLVVWDHDGRMVLVDGHNRYQIAVELELPQNQVPIEIMEFDSLNEVINFMLATQFGRRNLTTAQKAEVAIKTKALFEEEARRRSMANLKKGKESPEVDPGPPRETDKSRDRAAETVGISGRTLSRYEKVKNEGTPELLEAVKSGKVGIKTAARLTEQPAEVQNEVARAPNRKEARQAIQLRPKRDTIAMDEAGRAVKIMSSIPGDDHQRETAFDYVIEWCTIHRKES